MGISRFAAIATGTAFAIMLSSTAGAVASEGECISNEGTVMDLQGVKHCLVAVVPEEFQGPEYENDIKGVDQCTGIVRKTNIGDYCLIALEAKPAPVVTQEEAALPASSTMVTDAIGDMAKDAAVATLTEN